jgi:hypothetical protein
MEMPGIYGRDYARTPVMPYVNRSNDVIGVARPKDTLRRRLIVLPGGSSVWVFSR